MSQLTKQMRNKRLKVKANAEAVLHMETSLGTKHILKLDNVSITGVGAIGSSTLATEEGLFTGSLIPAAKIVFNKQEYALGRLILRSLVDLKGETLLGFSTVDMKVPVDGSLSKCFDLGADLTDYAHDFELSPYKFSVANFTDSGEENVDLFHKVKAFNVFMREWRKTPKYSYDQVRLPSMGNRVRLQKKRRNGREDYIIMGSNDYLGLAAHPEVREAAKKAIDEFGFGSTGSPITTGMTSLHEELSDYLARMMRKEKVILYNSGYAANIGLISALTRAQDLIVADFVSHASITDGMQMSKATSRFFKHNDVAHLDKVLKDHRDEYAGCMVITEGVFSMDGDVAPLDKIVEVSRKHQCRIMIDEAHSFGVVGPDGLGACEKFGILDKVDLVMGTFSKICGGIGGFVATTEEVYNWLYVLSRAHMFSVSIPPSTAAAALKALQIFHSTPKLVQDLRRNTKHFVDGLVQLGFPMNPNHESAVVPVMVGDERKLGEMNQILMENGIFVVPIVFPGVARDACRFRFTVSSVQSISDLDYVLNILESAMNKVGFNPDQLKPSGT